VRRYVARDKLRDKHPWSIGGGGAAELKEILDEGSESRLEDFVEDGGFMTITGDDESLIAPRNVWSRISAPNRPFITGESVRDWTADAQEHAIFLYNTESPDLPAIPVDRRVPIFNHLWPYRTGLNARMMFGKHPNEYGIGWNEFIVFMRRRFVSRYRIAFAAVATHNQFVLDRGGNLFNRHAPVITLPESGGVDSYLGLLALLNSSVACFWMKQVFHNKGSTVDQHGARQRTAPFEDFYEFDGTKLQLFPVPQDKPLEITRELDRLAQQLQSHAPSAAVSDSSKHTRVALDQARADWSKTLARMIALQEELDWQVYGLYGLTQNEECRMPKWEDVPPLALGERAFEIALARRVAAGKEQTAWFVRHGSTPITELPAHWPAAYRIVVERRLQLLEKDRNIGLIERPEYKRRWNVEPWDAQLVKALRSWLLDRLETYFSVQPSAFSLAVTSTSALSEHARKDVEFMRVAELSAGRPDFDVAALVAEFVEDESVPSLPGQRYKEAGLRKRSQWEETWTKQRQEDAITARLTSGMTEDEKKDPKVQQSIRNAVAAEVGEILVPPKYTSADFRSSSYWRLRGKLDVPKERWISYPGLERTADQSLPIAWAGWDHLQQAKALAAHYQTLQSDGAPEPQLARALASLQQLIPWLLQWHNDLDAEYGLKMGDYFQTFVADESRRLHLTPEDLTKIEQSRA
jgi:hypothetical protein